MKLLSNLTQSNNRTVSKRQREKGLISLTIQILNISSQQMALQGLGQAFSTVKCKMTHPSFNQWIQIYLIVCLINTESGMHHKRRTLINKILVILSSLKNLLWLLGGTHIYTIAWTCLRNRKLKGCLLSHKWHKAKLSNKMIWLIIVRRSQQIRLRK